VASHEPRWHPEAVAEAEEARNWYQERSPLAAHGFLLAVREAVQTVMEAPRRWPQHRYGCRRYVFPNRYPYCLIYRVKGGGEVEVVPVSHDKRRPGYWRGR
jgi:plasmid stabilization system protein ParE